MEELSCGFQVFRQVSIEFLSTATWVHRFGSIEGFNAGASKPLISMQAST